MRFTLILENETGEQINMITTANQYMTSEIDGLYSDNCVTTLSYCNVSNGTYYFAFAGRSNNSHPTIKQIQVLN